MISQSVSHYRIASKLGEGGMGEVYLAEDTALERKVAIKFLPEQLMADERAKKRLIREARAAAALDHPNICSIHEVAEHDGRTFIVMQYVEGETLADFIQRKPLELRESLDIAAQIADALAEAHAHGVIHRDIKPQNIMLTARGHVKVLDFGLAKVAQAELLTDSQAVTQSLLTEPGTIVGTVQYMSPEQVKGETVDARSDIFSLGVVLYEMMSGHHPFASETPAATISSTLTREPPPLARYSREAPVELERIVSKALRKDREERYQGIRDLVLDLKRLKEEIEFEVKVQRSLPPGTDRGAETAPGDRHARVDTSGHAAIRTEKTGATRGSRGAYVAVAFVILALTSIGVYVLSSDGGAIDSVAILPFVNENADPNIEYLADGIPESIMNSLSQLPQLKVMSRNSVFRYKGREIDAQEVGQKLGVRAVLTGRVTQRGDGLAISLELVDARDNSQIWGQQYNRRLADVFAMQGEMAKEISEKLRLKLSGAEQQQLAKRPTENLKAFQYYMQGRSYAQRRTREDMLEGLRYYEKAIAEDPNYALAYAGLADAYSGLGVRGYIGFIEGQSQAEAAARTALALDDNLAEGHAALGQASTQLAPYNFSLGERELRRAIELSPSLAIAHQYLGVSLVRQGRLDEGLEEVLKARKVALPYYLKRDHVRALELLRQANELGPAFASVWEAGVYIQNRLFDEALAELEKARRERKNDPILIYGTGMVYAAQGKRAEALQIIKELEEMSGPSLSQAYWMAQVYAALNEKELALTWLKRSFAARTIGAFYKDEPVWDNLRSEQRFADLLRQMGIEKN